MLLYIFMHNIYIYIFLPINMLFPEFFNINSLLIS